MLTGEDRPEFAGNIGREALRRCNVLIGNFVLPGTCQKQSRGEESEKWGPYRQVEHTGTG